MDITKAIEADCCENQSTAVITEEVWSSIEIFETTIACIGIIGNILVILVILRVQRLRQQTTNQLVVSLAFADLLACLFIILRNTRYLLEFNSEVAWEIFCRIVHDTVLWVNFAASVFNLVAVTLERYYAIVHPFKYQLRVTPKKVKIVIALAWILALACQSFTVYSDSYDPKIGDCVYTWPSPLWVRTVIGTFVFLFTYLIPLTVMIWAYWRILNSLLLSEKRVRSGQNSNGNGVNHAHKYRALKTRRKVVKMFLIVCLAFAICWGPNQCLFLASNFGYDVDYEGSVYHFTRILAALNSCINPLIYSVGSKNFRAGVRVLFRSVNKVGTQQSTEGRNDAFVLFKR
ncbi:galanin receptor 2a-like [Glandiceps talaboti]